jgi:methionyl-tRNA formyltransferase
MKLRPSPVKEAAAELGLPVETPERARAGEFVDRIRMLDLDALVVAAYGQILSERLLGAAARGGINLHGSILPKYRGAAPIQRAILAGDTETGITLMQMDRGMDTGDIIAIERLPIEPDETAGELQERLADLAASMARDWMPRIVQDEYPRVKQNKAEATYAPKVEKTEARLDPTMSAEEAYRRFRAFTPAPGAFLETLYGTIRLSEVRLRQENAAPGTYARPHGVAFVGGTLEMRTIQPHGRPKMSLDAWVNGLRIPEGAKIVEG